MEAGSGWAEGLFPELPLASLGKFFYQLPASLQLAAAQLGMWPQDAFGVFQRTQLPLGFLGWQVPGWCWWHLVSPLCVSEEPSGLCQGPHDAHGATVGAAGGQSYLTLCPAWLIVDCSLPSQEERQKQTLLFLQNCSPSLHS